MKIFVNSETYIYIYDHYTDDGVSGATFDRPDFNRMIQDIENKYGNCKRLI